MTAGRRVALLRGINVGRTRRVAMCELHAVAEHTGVALHALVAA